MASWSVIVPTNRPEQFQTFLDEWQDLFHDHDVALFVMQDLPSHDEGIRDAYTKSGLEGELHHHGTSRMRYLPKESDMCRSWAIYRAWKWGSDYVLSLDDDTRPEFDIFRAYESEFERQRPFSPYLSVGAMTSFRGELRGFPFQQRTTGKVMVQYGGWNGVLDYDAPTQLKGVDEDAMFWPFVIPVPKGAAVTTCIMNCAWRREFSREMWQLPLLDGRYNRFGDIWSGLIQKKVLDHTGGVMLINGRASVRHDRASNPKLNLRREKPGMGPNEGLWESMQEGDFRHATAGLGYHLFQYGDTEYHNHFLAARAEWLELFNETL